jgi:hypothetical protein
MAITKIAVLGAGNGGCAAAADLTLRGYEIRLFSRSESTLMPIAKRGGIELVEDGVEKFAAPFFVSTHLPSVVNGADLIIVAAPAVAHEYLARNLARYLVDGQDLQTPAYRRPFTSQISSSAGVKAKSNYVKLSPLPISAVCRKQRGSKFIAGRLTFAVRPFPEKTPSIWCGRFKKFFQM